MKIVTTLFGCVFVLMMFGGVMLAIHNFRGRTFTEPHTIATGAGITSANITLAADVMDGDNTNITITSNNALDEPVPFAYDSATRQITVNGLNASDTRILTISYPIAQLDGFTDTAVRLIPAYIIVAVICAVAGACYFAFKRGDD
jgi:hypothetical protein